MASSWERPAPCVGGGAWGEGPGWGVWPAALSTTGMLGNGLSGGGSLRWGLNESCQSTAFLFNTHATLIPPETVTQEQNKTLLTPKASGIALHFKCIRLSYYSTCISQSRLRTRRLTNTDQIKTSFTYFKEINHLWSWIVNNRHLRFNWTDSKDKENKIPDRWKYRAIEKTTHKVWAGMRSIQSISVIVSAGMEELITTSHTLVEAQWGKQRLLF